MEDSLGKELATSAIRHLLTATSGALVAAGVITDDQSTQYVVIGLAIGVYAFGQFWSWARKILRAHQP